MKNGNQNFFGIPKNRKAFSIFFYKDNGNSYHALEAAQRISENKKTLKML